MHSPLENMSVEFVPSGTWMCLRAAVLQVSAASWEPEEEGNSWQVTHLCREVLMISVTGNDGHIDLKISRSSGVKGKYLRNIVLQKSEREKGSKQLLVFINKWCYVDFKILCSYQGQLEDEIKVTWLLLLIMDCIKIWHLFAALFMKQWCQGGKINK